MAMPWAAVMVIVGVALAADATTMWRWRRRRRQKRWRKGGSRMGHVRTRRGRDGGPFRGELTVPQSERVENERATLAHRSKV
jgi:hypothetical protein